MSLTLNGKPLDLSKAEDKKGKQMGGKILFHETSVRMRTKKINTTASAATKVLPGMIEREKEAEEVNKTIKTICGKFAVFFWEHLIRVRLEIFPCSSGERGIGRRRDGSRAGMTTRGKRRKKKGTREEKFREGKEVHAGGTRISREAQVKFLGSQLKFGRRR